MTLTSAETQFLARQQWGHLATLGPDGSPQLKPLGFTWNEKLGTIDISGYEMARSAKYRNVQTRPEVAFAVNEVTEASMEGAHFLEIRGRAETAVLDEALEGQDREIIRIPPRRVISWNVNPGRSGPDARNLFG